MYALCILIHIVGIVNAVNSDSELDEVCALFVQRLQYKMFFWVLDIMQDGFMVDDGIIFLD